MLRTLVPCGLAVALVAPVAHAEGHATLEIRQACIAGAGLSAPHPASAPMLIAQSHEMAHGQMASFAVGDLVVESPWARESVTKTGAVYLIVRNGGAQDDRLIGVSTNVAEKAELHASLMQDGVMRMRPVEAVEVPAAGEAVLGPGGLHVMLMGLKAPLEEGKSFPLTLEFEHAGEIEVVTAIEDIGHAGAGAGLDHGHSN